MAIDREQLSELLSAYLDGEVGAREKAAVEDALRADPAARRLLDELRQTAAAVAALPRHSAPADLAAELDSQLERAQLLSGFRDEPHDAYQPKTPWQTSLKAAAMLAIVLGAGWWFLSQQQEPNPSRMAESTSTPTREVGSETAPAAGGPHPSPPVRAESLIASGADPVLLVKNSFDPEPIRLRVVARDAAERDAWSKRFTTQLAEANTENLAHRGASSEKQSTVGSFFVEGKAGVNFTNAQERQILVRVPQAQARRIVDEVVPGGKISTDQLALQIGPAVVRGPDKARDMLQMLADKDQPGPATPNAAPSSLAESARPNPSTGLLKTLGEIVGLGPLVHDHPPHPTTTNEGLTLASRKSGDSGTGEASSGPAVESASKENVTAADKVASAEMADTAGKTEPPTHRTLVSKRLDIARAKRAEEKAARESDATAVHQPPASTTSPIAPAVAAADQFITMVIEFTIPETKPAARPAPGRNRS